MAKVGDVAGMFEIVKVLIISVLYRPIGGGKVWQCRHSEWAEYTAMKRLERNRCNGRPSVAN